MAPERLRALHHLYADDRSDVGTSSPGQIIDRSLAKRLPFARFLCEAVFGVEDCDGPVGADQSLAARHKLLLR
jgi:hypothetical protein